MMGYFASQSCMFLKKKVGEILDKDLIASILVTLLDKGSRGTRNPVFFHTFQMGFPVGITY